MLLHSKFESSVKRIRNQTPALRNVRRRYHPLPCTAIARIFLRWVMHEEGMGNLRQ